MPSNLRQPGATAPRSCVVAAREDVLVVDDDHLFRKRLTARLKEAGADVYQAGSVFEAIEQLEFRHVDLVICTSSMPHAGGTDLLAYVRHRGFACRFVLLGDNLAAGTAGEVAAQDGLVSSKSNLLRILGQETSGAT